MYNEDEYNEEPYDENMEFNWEDDEARRKDDDDEDMLNEEEKAYDDGEEYRNERNAFERAGPADDLIGMFSDENVRTRDPLELFRRKVRAISLQINDKFPGVLPRPDINNMLIKAETISHIDFKSPTAYVLGYIASNGGTKINEKSVDYVFKNIIPFVNDPVKESDFVKEPDVIRYARFWLKL
jgi:hypothetical protein